MDDPTVATTGPSSRWRTGVKNFAIPCISALLFGGSLCIIPQLAPTPGGYYFDANGYIKLAAEIASNGLWGGYTMADVRTYLYPLLLSLPRTAVQQEPSSFMALYAKWILVPYAAIAVCTWLLFRCWIVYGNFFLWIAILLNPLLLQYIPVTLTESCFLLTFASLSGLIAFYARPASSTAPPSILEAPLLMLLGVFAGALPVIRPAGLPVSICAFLAVLHVTLRKQTRPRSASVAIRNAASLTSIVLSFGCGFFIAVFPQIVLNVKHFDQFTFLPVFDLDTHQFRLGLENFKYTTLVAPTTVNPHGYYPTVRLIGNLDAYKEVPLNYYRDHVWLGLILLLTHVYQSVNYDFLQIYVPVTDYAIVSWHQLLSSLVTVFGLFGAGYALRHFRKEILGDPVQTFLLLALLSVSALNSLTAIETRYGMLATAVLSYFALRFVLHVVPALNRRQNFIIASGALAYAVLSAWVSKEFVEETRAFTIVWI